MFSKNQRITKKEDFQKIYKNGYIYNLDYLKVFILKNELKTNRISVIVSKKISPLAVVRNRIKRKLRHTLISSPDIFPKGSDILINVNQLKVLDIKNSDIKDKLAAMVQKLKNRS